MIQTKDFMFSIFVL